MFYLFVLVLGEIAVFVLALYIHNSIWISFGNYIHVYRKAFTLCIVLMPSCLWLFSTKNENDTKQCTSAHLIFTIYILRRQRLLFHNFKLSVFKLDRSDCDCFPSVRNCSVFLSFMPHFHCT